MHYYRFNIKDWNNSTSRLSLEQEAIYFRLINYYYDKERPIPTDYGRVLFRLGLTGKETEVEFILEEFFEKDGDVWRHHICDEIIAGYQKNVSKNKNNGKKGGRPSIRSAPNGEF